MFPGVAKIRSRFGGAMLALAAVLMLVGGCEERVVRTENSWIGSQYTRIEEDRRERARKNWSLGKEIDKSLNNTGKAIGNTGKALFGWTGDVGRGIGKGVDGIFESDGKPAKRPASTNTPSNHRYSADPPRTSTSSGSGY